MFITLTSPGGHKVRVNTDKILKYSSTLSDLPSENSDSYVQVTEIILEQRQIFCVKETPEQIDEILRTSFITVYERK